MTEESKSKKKLLPAYVSYKTFLAFVDDLKATAVPSHIDRSIMTKMSGGTQGQLLASLRFLNLIDDEDVVQPELRELVGSRGQKDKWNASLSKVLRAAYPTVFDSVDVETATGQTLTEAFRKTGLDGATLQKSYRYFVLALEDAGVKISPHIKRGGPKAPPRRKKPRGNGEVADLGLVSGDGHDRPPDNDIVKLPPANNYDGVHPMIAGLVQSLPEPGSAMTERKRTDFEATFGMVLKLAYKVAAKEEDTE